MKFIIAKGRKYYSNYVVQNDYWIIQTKLLSALFKNNNEINLIENQHDIDKQKRSWLNWKS